MTRRTEMSDSSYTSLKKNSTDNDWSLNAAAQGSFWKWAAPSGGYEHHVNTEATDAFDHASSGQEQHSLYVL